VRHLTSSGAFNIWRITAKKRMVAKLNVIKRQIRYLLRTDRLNADWVWAWRSVEIDPVTLRRLGRIYQVKCTCQQRALPVNVPGLGP
jgi:hypothetical protein